MTREIPLTQDKVALVSDHRYEYLSQFNWYAARYKNTFYAQRRSGKTTLKMHREILKPPDGFDADHRDGDGLNNQDENLRVCTRAENGHNRRKDRDNTSGYKGVSWHKGQEKWNASIRVNGKGIHIGSFDDKELAARAYDRAALELHGEYAKTNF